MDTWRAEFERARHAGLDGIEWIYEEPTADRNPLLEADGIAAIAAAATENGVRVSSICADWFMARPFGRGTAAERTERRNELTWLIERAAELGAAHVLVPFVDDSSLAADEIDVVAEDLKAVAGEAPAPQVAIHVETDLPPAAYLCLLDRLPTQRIGVTYDIGNSASLGYDPSEELRAYGDRVGSVHVKDRLRGGASVPVGTGDARLPAVFGLLRRAGFDGWFVLQPARGEEGGEVAWVRGVRDTVLQRWEDAR